MRTIYGSIHYISSLMHHSCNINIQVFIFIVNIKLYANIIRTANPGQYLLNDKY